MRVQMQRFAAAMFVVMALAIPSIAADWDKIGERRVTDRVDRDTIIVTALRGKFDAIKIGVREHAVRFYKVVVNYRKGPSEEIELRDVIPAGGESRVIDLRGGNRVIRSIEFRYEAKSLGRDGASITIWGRR